MAIDVRGLSAALGHLAGTVHAARGFYLDARVGFLYGHERVERIVDQFRVQNPSHDPEQVAFIYGFGPPEARNFQHVVSQAEAMRRMADGGRNHVVLGHWFVVVVYEFWETRHRKAIASALGIDRDHLRLPIMGDLRRLRNAILHEEGRISPGLAREMETLTFIDATDLLTLGPFDIDRIADQMEDGLRNLLTSLGIRPEDEAPPDPS